MEECVLYDRECINCGECDVCDLDSSKHCDDCGECLNTAEEYVTLDIKKFYEEKGKNSKQ